MKTLVGSAIFAVLAGYALAQGSSGCPGERLIGDHTAPSTVWTMDMTNNGTVTLSQRVGGNGYASGDAVMNCVNGRVSVEWDNMSNGLHYYCEGPLKSGSTSLTTALTCKAYGGDNIIGHISAGARFE